MMKMLENEGCVMMHSMGIEIEEIVPELSLTLTCSRLGMTIDPASDYGLCRQVQISLGSKQNAGFGVGCVANSASAAAEAPAADAGGDGFVQCFFHP